MKIFEVSNPSTPAAQKLRFTAKATSLFTNAFGFLQSNGAVLGIEVNAVSQCFYLAPGTFWSSRSGGNGYLYRDAAGANGPVKILSLKRNDRGLFQMRGLVLGRLGTLTLVPPNPGVEADVRLILLSGYEYCAGTGGGIVVKNDARSFKVKTAPAPSACAVSCSPSGAFLD